MGSFFEIFFPGIAALTLYNHMTNHEINPLTSLHCNWPTQVLNVFYGLCLQPCIIRGEVQLETEADDCMWGLKGRI